jgi:hypothetical protein
MKYWNNDMVFMRKWDYISWDQLKKSENKLTSFFFVSLGYSFDKVICCPIIHCFDANISKKGSSSSCPSSVPIHLDKNVAMYK